MSRQPAPTVPCAHCGAPAAFTVGWLAPMPKDARADTADVRPACSVRCAWALRDSR